MTMRSNAVVEQLHIAYDAKPITCACLACRYIWQLWVLVQERCLRMPAMLLLWLSSPARYLPVCAEFLHDSPHVVPSHWHVTGR